MAVQRVVVFTMHEAETERAKELVSVAEETEGFVLGEASEAQIAQLEAEGLIVQPVEQTQEERPQTPGRTRARVATLARSFGFAPALGTSLDDLKIDLSRPQVYLIRINGPILADYLTKLNAAGATLMECYVGGGYSSFLLPGQLAAVRALPFVARVELYQPADTLVAESSGGEEALGTPGVDNGVRSMITWDVRLHREDDMPAMQAWLEERRIALAGSAQRKLRIYCLEGDPAIREIAALPIVQKVEQYISPKLFNDHAQAVVGLTGPAGRLPPQDGTGQIIAVADTGLDMAHPDFNGRTVAVVALGRVGRADDPHGHGTHVSGTALGSGAASSGRITGAAPRATLYFQSLLDDRGKLGGLPLNLGDLFEPAYLAGARIHNNSWGAATPSTYTLNSDEVDNYVRARKDMLVVFAAGNEGQAADRINSGVGEVDWLSLGAPGTAKNALTVGACCSSRTSGGWSGRTWREVWPDAFPDPLIATLSISGNDQEMAGFSSRGPSDDRRIKPDIVAPGTDILSARSAAAPTHRFWDLEPLEPHYAYMGGTSMAAPLVSGCAALVRQYYLEDRQHEPSAALLRATLINGAVWLSGPTANASNQAGAIPPGNFDQGFGRLNMLTTLPMSRSDLRLAFVDNWRETTRQLTLTGDRQRFFVTVEQEGSLRICLAYSDAPGRGLQNNLNLLLQLPDNSKRVGNHQLRHSLGRPDVDNNVEVIRLENAVAGTYLVQVTAANLLDTPQDFALVVSGRIADHLIQT